MNRRATWCRRAALKPFLYTALLVNALIGLAGFIAWVDGWLGPAQAAAIALALAIQATVFLAAGFPAARAAAESRWVPERLALGLSVFSVLPYALVALSSSTFTLAHLSIVVTACFALAFWYVVFPVRGDGLRWQDILFIAVITFPQMMSRDFPILREIYVGPAPIERMDFLGKLTLFSLGALAMLSIRKIPRVEYELALRPRDWPGGLLYAAAFLPFGIGLGLALGYIQFGNDFAANLDWFLAAGLVVANALGLYLGVAIPEELLFRGILQNLFTTTLRSRWAALAAASVLFGLAHWPRRYPDFHFALLAAVAGIFYGLAYMRNQRVPEAALTHTLVVLVQRFAFT